MLLLRAKGWSVPDDLMWGNPARDEEFSLFIAFLVSDDAKFVSGKIIKYEEATLQGDINPLQRTTERSWYGSKGYS